MCAWVRAAIDLEYEVMSSLGPIPQCFKLHRSTNLDFTPPVYDEEKSREFFDRGVPGFSVTVVAL